MVDATDDEKLYEILTFAAKTIRRKGETDASIFFPNVPERRNFLIYAHIGYDDALKFKERWRDVLTSLGAVNLKFNLYYGNKMLSIKGRFSKARLAHITEFCFRIEPVLDCGGHPVRPLKEIVSEELPARGTIFAPRKLDAFEWLYETLRANGTNDFALDIHICPAAQADVDKFCACNASVNAF